MRKLEWRYRETVKLNCEALSPSSVIVIVLDIMYVMVVCEDFGVRKPRG